MAELSLLSLACCVFLLIYLEAGSTYWVVSSGESDSCEDAWTVVV